MRLPVTVVFAMILAVVTIFHPVDGKDPWLYDTGNLLSSLIENHFWLLRTSMANG